MSHYYKQDRSPYRLTSPYVLGTMIVLSSKMNSFHRIDILGGGPRVWHTDLKPVLPSVFLVQSHIREIMFVLETLKLIFFLDREVCRYLRSKKMVIILTSWKVVYVQNFTVS